MEDFSAFIVAVLSNWIMLASGAFGLALSLVEKVRKRPATRFLAYLVGYGCVLTAFFYAWRDEHTVVKSFAAFSWEGKIEYVSVVQLEDVQLSTHEFIIMNIVTIRNLGAPNTADDFVCSFIIDGKTVLAGRPISFMRDNFAIYPDKRTESVKREDWLERKTGEDPIEHLGKRVGRVACRLPPTVTPPMLRGRNVIFLVSFFDAKKNPYSMRGRWAVEYPTGNHDKTVIGLDMEDAPPPRTIPKLRVLFAGPTNRLENYPNDP